MALFYAEENDITFAKANQMPIVNLFGPTFKRMLRDAIFATGNYGEMYEKTLEHIVARSGSMNMLNSNGDPQLAPMPGFEKRL